MKKIDWNKASELGLIERINREVLHPLGLAMVRVPETGESPGLLISDDGGWQYSPAMPEGPIYSKEEVLRRLADDDDD
ncbi:hypothetical protein [Chromohalobacter sp. 48-RD10]|uniref:DUF7415 domain-containing protein n=1 Tax=Chromohalobacter sp. 48-RD10 TaxID=2994063 RepID=UPI0024695D07|nr:hypothetical protein [Chromohalobacter sp. 48-RD10]